MAKRRRERDRPKAANDAPYNPNKRILLSYDSEEEHNDVDCPAGTGHPSAIEAATANYQFEEYPYDDDDDGDPQVTIPAHDFEPCSLQEEVKVEFQVDQDAQEENTISDTAAKVQEAPATKSDRRSTWQSGIGRNWLTGQRPALGSLAYECDEDEFGDEECESSDAMAYLRAVRSVLSLAMVMIG